MILLLLVKCVDLEISLGFMGLYSFIQLFQGSIFEHLEYWQILRLARPLANLENYPRALKSRESIFLDIPQTRSGRTELLPMTVEISYVIISTEHTFDAYNREYPKQTV